MQGEIKHLFTIMLPVILLINLSGNQRPFRMKVSNYGCKDFVKENSKSLIKEKNRVIFRFKRDYKCSFLCFNRPSMEVFLRENSQNKKIGTIYNPWYCFNIGCNVLDENGNLRYIVEASCC